MEQAKIWNGAAGNAWAESQDVIDEVFRPFEEMLVAAATARGARRVLDVGCGCGGTTLAMARALGAECTGVDVSEPMLAVARERAVRDGLAVDFVCADAQTYAFDDASFDMIVSRFGVMFFADFVEAFANLRRAAAPGAELRFLAFRSAGENPFMTTAERAAAPLLPLLPPRRPDAPGQFALASGERIDAILRASGWAEIEIEPVDVACTFAEKDLESYFTKLGPLGLVLREADEVNRQRIVEVVRAAFAPYVHGGAVRFEAACWMAAARA
jgi:SAM-dependent methyltransferase